MLDVQGYAKALGLTLTRQRAVELNSRAKKELSCFGRRAKILESIADFVLERKN